MELLKMFSTTMAYELNLSPQSNGSVEDLNNMIKRWVKEENIKEYRILNANMMELPEWKCIVYSVGIAYTT